MNAFKELDSQYLSGDFGPDYWSDEAIDQARNLLTKFTERDWEALSNQWSTGSIEWQVRCADMLGYADPNFAQPILKDMIKSKQEEVAQAAQESLSDNRSSLPTKVDHYPSRGGVLKYLFGYSFFIIVGVYMSVTQPLPYPACVSIKLGILSCNPTAIHVLGFLTVSFFGLCGLWYLYQLISRRAILTIFKENIMRNKLLLLVAGVILLIGGYAAGYYTPVPFSDQFGEAKYLVDSSQCKVGSTAFVLQIRSNVKEPDSPFDQDRSLWVIQDHYAVEVQLGINTDGTDGLLFHANQSSDNFISVCDKTSAIKTTENNALIAFLRAGGASQSNSIGTFVYDFNNQRVVYISPTIGKEPHTSSSRLVKSVNTQSGTGLTFAVSEDSEFFGCIIECANTVITPTGQNASGKVDEIAEGNAGTLIWWVSVTNKGGLYTASTTKDDLSLTYQTSVLKSYFANQKDFQTAAGFDSSNKLIFRNINFFHTTLSNGVGCVYLVDGETSNLPKDNSNGWHCAAKK